MGETAVLTMQSETATATETETETSKKRINVGLIMPIAEIAGLNEMHWEDVRRIIGESLKDDVKYEMNIRLVSHSDEVRVIQTSIVQNIYNDDIVIIDVSAKNANVMFEFGMRLAFDKPFVVIKDNVTPYIFDTGNIQHLEYPRDLRYTNIEKFKVELRKKVLHTLEYAKQNPEKSMYLEQYGNLKPSKIDEKEVGEVEYLQKTLDTIRGDFKRLENKLISPPNNKVQSRNIFKIEVNSSEELYNIVLPIVDSYFIASNIDTRNYHFNENLLEFTLKELEDRFVEYSPYLLRDVIERCVEEVKGNHILPF